MENLQKVTDPEILKLLNEGRVEPVNFENTSQEVSQPKTWSEISGGKDILDDVVNHFGSIPSNIKNSALSTLKMLNPDTWGSLIEMSQQPDFHKKVIPFLKDSLYSFTPTREKFRNEPLQFWMDLSLIGGLITKIAKLGKLDKLANFTSTLSDIASPLEKPIQALESIRWLGTKGHGFTTGLGSEIMGKIVKPSPTTRAYTLEPNLEEMAQKTSSGLKQIINEKRQMAKREYGGLKQEQTVVDLTPVYDELQTQMKDWGISQPTGKINKKTGRIQFSQSDFRGSILEADAKAQRDFTEIYNSITARQTGKVATTVPDVDILKRIIDSKYSENSNIRALTQTLKDKIENEVISVSPRYAELMKGYREASELEDKLRTALSLKTEADRLKNIDATVKKLTSIFKENQEFRKDMVKVLEERSGVPITDMVAGYYANKILPSSGGSGAYFAKRLPFMEAGPLAGALGAYGVGTAYGVSGLTWLSPILAMGVLQASPRIVAEFWSAISKGEKILTKVEPYGKIFGVGTIETGKIKPETIKWLNKTISSDVKDQGAIP